ncbi:MAG: hypothetical protein OHK0046_24280 [Anaerolineae bacterium]
MRYWKFGLLGLFMLVAAVFSPLLGQEETIITMAAPNWMGDIFNRDLFAEFEAQNPGVKVVLVPSDNNTYFGNPAFDAEEFYTNAERYVTTADVIYMPSRTLHPETIYAGYYLDLSPLIAGDPTFDQSDFVPTALESMQMDGGTWGLPVSVTIELLIYDMNAFDEAGVPYPNENWTWQDLEQAARDLTVRNAEGEVEVPGFSGYGFPLVYYSLTGQNFYDETQLPSTPDFTSDPELITLYQTWQDFQEEIQPTSGGSYSFDAIPMSISGTWQLTDSFASSQDREWAGALLPGGVAGISTEGFAVSGATEQPVLAYELVKFITQQPEVVYRFFGDSPARRSLIGVEPEDSTIFRPEIEPEVQALIDEALENGIPYTELRFGDYLFRALVLMDENGLTPEEAAQQAEDEVNTSLEEARARGASAVLVVPTPVPTPSINDDQIVLNFGLNLFTSNVDLAPWNDLIADFLAANPQVGNVDLITQAFSQEDLDAQDCRYEPVNIIQFDGYFDTSAYLNLDPFMDIDPEFDRSDFIGNTLEQVQRDNRTWAYPIALYPSILWYNSEMFQEVGAQEPIGGWTMDAFLDSVDRLSTYTPPQDQPQFVVFQPETFNNTYILMLAAAFGGLPYDYRTEEPTVNLTDPLALEAVRQTLDLAREGIIAYQELDTNGGGGFMMGGAAITSDSFNTFSFRLQQRDNENISGGLDQLTLYPSGSQYIPVAYDLGVAYINATAKSPEACYAFIKMMAERPELFSGVPVRQSQIDDPSIASVQGEDVAEMFRRLAEQITAPDAIEFPGPYGSATGSLGSYVEQTWLNRAFDAYVLEDVPLETALTEAEESILAYRECTSTIPEQDITQIEDPEASMLYFRQFIDCAVAISPELRETYSFYYEEPE